MRIRDLQAIKSRSANVVDGDERVGNVIQVFNASGCGAVIVRDDWRQLDSMLTERDVVQGLARFGSALLDMPVSRLATTAAVSCAPDDLVTAVATLMADRTINYLAVRRTGRMVDIIAIDDILRERLANRRRATRAVFALAGGMAATA